MILLLHIFLAETSLQLFNAETKAVRLPKLQGWSSSQLIHKACWSNEWISLGHGKEIPPLFQISCPNPCLKVCYCGWRIFLSLVQPEVSFSGVLCPMIWSLPLGYRRWRSPETLLANDLEMLRFIPSSSLESHTARFFSSKGLFAYILVKIQAFLIKEPENKDRGTGIWYINKRQESNSLLGQMSLQDNIAELIEKNQF